MFHHRFLLISFPGQGHINPALQFAKLLIAMGAHVTLATTVFMHRRMANKATIHGLSFAIFSDGYDGGFLLNSDGKFELYASEFRRRGSEYLTSLIVSSAQEGHPFTCLVYTMLLPWAAEVARGFQIPTALLWTQAATVFRIYHYDYNDHGNYIRNITKEPSRAIELPGLPLLLAPRDLPSFMLASNVYSFALPMFEEQLQDLEKETNPRILVNTFEALEPDALKAVDKFNMIPIGPLIPSAFLDGKNPTDTSFGGDLFHASNGYLEWLDSKPELSVVYVSFGSLSLLSKKQMEEIARALLDSGRPFLWVIREKEKKGEEQTENLQEKGKEEEEEEEELSYREELEKIGKIVKWCTQLEVLSHPSLGCFVTHCGWNSTVESLVSGVPVVAFPQWTDQKTNAKLIEDVWKTGVRVDDVNEDGIAHGDEIKRCLEVVMGSGEKGEELRRNAKKWKSLAREAAKEGESSDNNLKAFLDDVGGEGVRVATTLLV